MIITNGDKDIDIYRLVQSIGKRCFENCYEIAKVKRDSLTIDDLIKHDPALQGTKKGGLTTRLNCIKRIFRAGLQDDALALSKNRKR